MQVPNPKAGLTFHIIEYLSKPCFWVRFIFFINKLLPQRQFKNHQREYFSDHKRRYIGFHKEVKETEQKIIGHQKVMEGELKNKVRILLHFCLVY